MTKVEIKPLSVNEVRQGKRFKSKKYLLYEKCLLVMLPRKEVPDGEFGISFEVGYSDKKSDLDNFLKPFLDVLSKKYNFNDNKIYEMKLKKKIVDKGNEYIEFAFYKIEKK